MKRMLFAVCVAGILVSALAVSAPAAENNWIVRIQPSASATSIVASAGSLFIGVGPDYLDTFREMDPNGNPEDNVGLPPNPPSDTLAHAAFYRWDWPAPFATQDLREPVLSGQKAWEDLLVWAGPAYTAAEIHLRVSAIGGNPGTIGGLPAVYTLSLVGAPAGYAGETSWELPADQNGLIRVISLPVLDGVKSAVPPVSGEGPLVATQTGGYLFDLTVEVVPEPGSLMALGAGLTGFIGLALRRRS